MCGIFGYVGNLHDVAQTVGPALRQLEYRGYDSWGVVWDQNGRLETIKRVGRVPEQMPFQATSPLAIGHTRWATHGGVTERNAHPHIDCTGRIAIVHNGVIENVAALRDSLSPLHRMSSETDSEVVAHLLEERILAGESIVEALRHVFPRLMGQNAIIALDHQAREIAAVMTVSPLLIGLGMEGTYIASDPIALWPRCTSMMVIPDGSYISLRQDILEVFDQAGHAMQKPEYISVPAPDSDPLGGYAHYMAKEMAEQGSLLELQATPSAHRSAAASLIREAKTVILTGCGSALIAARLGATWFGELAGKRAIAVAASEFADVGPFLGSDSVIVCLSQSGETADLLEAIRTARTLDVPTVGLINVQHSTAARSVDALVPLGCGRERSVLATKSFTAMLGELLALAGELGDQTPSTAIAQRSASSCISRQTVSQPEIERAATYLANQDHVLVIGKGSTLPIAQEAALKLKEAAYVHAEAFPAGELKHGAIALVEEGLPCLVFLDSSPSRKDLLTSAIELKSRGAFTICIGPGHEKEFDCFISLPDAGLAMPIVQAHVVHQMAYHLALKLGLDPDYPRNLAKSVTVK